MIDDIGIGQAILLALSIYCGLSFVFSSLGSFGLYKLLAARGNPSAKTISIVAFVLSLVVGIGGLFTNIANNYAVLMVALFAYAVFGLTAWLTHRRT